MQIWSQLNFMYLCNFRKLEDLFKVKVILLSLIIQAIKFWLYYNFWSCYLWYDSIPSVSVANPLSENKKWLVDLRDGKIDFNWVLIPVHQFDLPVLFTKWPSLKLVCTNLKVLLCRHFKNYHSLSLCTYTSDECHAGFHLYAASPGARNTEQAKITKWKILVHSRIRTLTRYNVQLTSPLS